MDLRVAAYAVIERRGKILLTHWRRGHLHGWTLPGGGLEAGEDPRDAVVREISEETGLTGKVGKLLGVDSRVMMREEVADGVDPALHTIRIVYRATVLDGPLQNEVDGSSDEARWVPLKDVGSLKTLSLVQTGLRMAGITQRNGGNAGGAKNGGKSAGGAKGAAAKPANSKNNAQKSSSAKGGSGRGGSAKAGAGRATVGAETLAAGAAHTESVETGTTASGTTAQGGQSTGKSSGNRSRRARSRARARSRKRAEQ